MIEKFVKSKGEYVDGIYLTQFSKSSTKKVVDFYKDKPFPDYKNNETKLSLLANGDGNTIVKNFKNHIGFNSSILEVGAGTSQLSMYFAIGNNNKIFALDPAFNSLRLGCNFAKENNIKNINFIQGDIFEDIFYENSFDYVWCSGVLHHTEDPKLGFQILSKYIKKNGYVFVGLYNKYGRKILQLRRALSKIFGKKIIKFIDPKAKELIKNNQIKKLNSWINDQYFHPIESTHTFKEVLRFCKMFIQ